MPYEIILFMIIIALASLLIYLNYRKNKKTEPFENIVIPSSYSLYKQNDSMNFDKQTKIYKDTMSDNKSLMHVYGCGINIGTVPNALNILVQSSAKGLFVIPFDINTDNFSDVNARVYNTLQKFYDENGRSTIQGQVYVVISQAPFYRDENDNLIALQYNANSYLNLPVNVMKPGVTTASTRIQFYCYMIFTAYNNKGKPIKDEKIRKIAVLNIKKNFRHNESLCFISCPLHSDLPCGCSSQDVPYQSNCLESERPTKMSAGEKYSYAILYRINSRFSDLTSNGILASDYSDLDWSPDTINPIPTLENPNPKEGKILKKPYSGGPGIIMYQHCGFKGWKSQLIPPGKYTMDQLRYYDVKQDVSTYQIFKNVKVKLYLAPNFDNPIPIDTKDGYITGTLPCFTKYKNLNDNLQAIEIIYDKNEIKKQDKIEEKKQEKKEQKKEEKKQDKQDKKDKKDDDVFGMIKNKLNF